MCHRLDLRPDSRMAKFLAKKIIVLVIGFIQLILWVSALFMLIAPPESVRLQISVSKPGVLAVAVVIILARTGFSCFFILGVLKNNKTFIQVYCYLIMVVIVTLVLAILVNICTQPTRFGFSGFLSSTFAILLEMLIYVIVRNYYLTMTQSAPPSNQTQSIRRV